MECWIGAGSVRDCCGTGLDRWLFVVYGRRIEEIELPPGTNIGAIVRGDQVVIAHDDVIVQADDHVVLFLVDKKRIREVEKLFHAPLTFA